MYTAADIFKKAGSGGGATGEPKAYPRPLGMRSAEKKRARTTPEPKEPLQTQGATHAPGLPIAPVPGEPQNARQSEARTPPSYPPQMNPAYVPPPARNPEIYKGLMARHDRVSQRHIRK